jgi:hypothetical protein
MGSRLAYTAGMVLRADDGTPRRVPAGACWIDRYSAAPGVCTVRWVGSGTDYTAQVSSVELGAFMRGCIIQYA